MTFDEWFSSVFGTIQTHQADMFKDELEALWNLAQANRKWVGLTDDEIYKITFTLQGEHWRKITDAIEAKLKEKNT